MMYYCYWDYSVKGAVFEWQGSHIRNKELLLRQLFLNQGQEILCYVSANKVVIWRGEYVLSISTAKVTYETTLWQWIQESRYRWPRLVSGMTEMFCNRVINILYIFLLKILAEFCFWNDLILPDVFLIVTINLIYAITLSLVF